MRPCMEKHRQYGFDGVMAHVPYLVPLGDRGTTGGLPDKPRFLYLQEWTPEVHVNRYLGLIERLGSQPAAGQA